MTDPKKKIRLAAVILVVLGLGLMVAASRMFYHPSSVPKPPAPRVLSIRSIDTMKYSRDLAREKLHDPAFVAVINQQMKDIAGAGANYVAIDTPYDREFIPFLREWVTAARHDGLHVWFRGNFSGWEGWFGYPSITRQEHVGLTRNFILNNPTLFADGDIFTPCAECENGGPGDPRQTGDVVLYRQFLIAEKNTSSQAFLQIGKNVQAGYFSMNFDVARMIMDQPTAAAVGGVVVIDHYVKSPKQLAADVQIIAGQSGGQVILGEFGAPIPDINGQMNDQQQADWINQALSWLSGLPEVDGVNYWTSFGGSTALWNNNGQPKPAVAVITNYYSKK